MDDALKVAEKFAGAWSLGGRINSDLYTKDLAALITRERRQARIEALEWAAPRAGVDGMGRDAIDAELARLKGTPR